MTSALLLGNANWLRGWCACDEGETAAEPTVEWGCAPGVGASHLHILHPHAQFHLCSNFGWRYRGWGASKLGRLEGGGEGLAFPLLSVPPPVLPLPSDLECP